MRTNTSIEGKIALSLHAQQLQRGSLRTRVVSLKTILRGSLWSDKDRDATRDFPSSNYKAL